MQTAKAFQSPTLRRARFLSTITLLPFALLDVAHALEPFPLAETVQLARANLTNAAFTPTRLAKEDYLKTVAGIVNYFHHFQTSDGRIIDPFLRREVQYSTPCYAWAAAALAVSGEQTNLLDSAALALDAALQELADDKTADNHGDFFTFPSVLAYEHLRDHVPKERRERWEKLFRAMDPRRCYQDLPNKPRDPVHNWNIVAVAGEFLRHQNGFTDLSYVETSLGEQMHWFTANGQYRDPNVPMAYDHFPRHFLAAMLARGYDEKFRPELAELLDRAAWTSLLIQSPRGELPTGGRSAQHQWNEAEQCVSYEVWAARKHRAGDEVAAKAFKRAAHLALQSIQHWVRPSGELWIVKNRFDPAVRHGFEGYSSHSQYNLLAASMMATAWKLADDSIAEGACPADVGGFVVELPEFHKVFANCGGLYLELDTAADPHYNSTGLIRVHKSGVDSLVGPSDSAPAEPSPLAVGIAWQDGKSWQSLAGAKPDQIKTKVTVEQTTVKRVRFRVYYELARAQIGSVEESYDLSPELVRVTAETRGGTPQIKVRFPAIAFDGQNTSRIAVTNSTVTVTFGGSRQNFSVKSPSGVQWQLPGERVACRNGFLEAIEGVCKGRRVAYTLQPESQRRGPTPSN